MRGIKRILATSLVILMSFTFCIEAADRVWNSETLMSANAKAKAKTKTTLINLEKGDTYKIKIKKNSKIKLSRKKIVKVSKKGVIKALKVGKCKVTVKKGKKTWKYNVVVRKKKQPEEIVATPSPTPELSIVGGCMAQNGFLVDRIDAKDELLSYVYLVDDPSIEHSYMPKDPGIKYVRIEVYTEALKNIKVGDSVWFVKHVNDKVEISGDTCIYVERVMISLMKSNTPTPAPTEKPVLAADSWLNFKLNSDSIWLNNRYISGTTENIGGGDGIIEIKVGNTIIASKELKADETEFSIPVDFSECKEGDKVIITYSGIGGDLKVSEGDDYIVEHMRWPAKHEYTLKKGTTCALIRKEFKILQDEITTETKCLTYKTDVIGESLNYYIKIDDERVKAEQYVTDNGVFDLQVDFSSYEPGTEIVVGISSYGYRTDKGTHFEECNVGFSEKIFILGEAKNATDEVVE